MKTLLPDLWTREFMTDPFRTLQRDLLGRELPKMFEVPEMKEGMPQVPAMNIAETETAIEATLEIPGVDEKDIKVRVEGDRLIVSGEKNHGNQTRGERLACDRAPFRLVLSRNWPAV